MKFPAGGQRMKTEYVFMYTEGQITGLVARLGK